MKTIAEMTGGREYYNNNNIGDLFRRAANDSGRYYLLTYYTSSAGRTGWHKIDVKVRKEKVQVRSRDGFFLTKEMAVTSALTFATLPLSGVWQDVEPAGDKRKVHFSLFIPAGATAIDTDHDNHVNVDFLVVARDLKRKDVTTFSQQLNEKLPFAGVSRIEEHGLTYINTLTVSCRPRQSDRQDRQCRCAAKSGLSQTRKSHHEPGRQGQANGAVFVVTVDHWNIAFTLLDPMPRRTVACRHRIDYLQ
jgi:hypothetical protein